MVGIVGGYSTEYRRHMSPGVRTQDLLAQAIVGVLKENGKNLSEVDGLGVSSFTLGPDQAIDLAWRLGLKLTWLAEDNHGGVGGANLLRSAKTAVQEEQAKNIVIVAGDHLPPRCVSAGGGKL